MIVIDASALVDAFIGDVSVSGRIAGEDLHGPHLIDLEVASALRRLEAAGTIGPSAGDRIVAALQTADIHRHDHVALLGLVWSLRHNLSAYDAAYVALAAALDVPLVTTDRRLAKSPDLPCTVELL